MDTKRLVLFVVFSFSIMMLWDAWQVKDRPINADNTASETSTAAETSADVIPAASSQAVVTADSNQTQVSGERIKVSTDLYQAEISTLGGDIRHLTLNKHRADGKEQGRFVLMDDAAKPMFYVAQSGLIGKDLPNHKTLFTAEKSRYVMASGSNTLQVVLSWLGNDGTKVEKIYTFHRDRYEIDLTHRINNAIGGEVAPSVYYQITHDSESNQGSTFMPTFTGGAYYTDADKFKKIKFSEMADRNLSLKTKDGWIGVIQHYFASAWIPKAGTSQEFYTKQLTDNLYAVGVVNPIGKIAPAATNEISATLFSGPQTEADLEAAAPGLEYAVDYGWLTIIAKPLFWLLSNIHGFIGNWGVAIIVLTILLKAAFFKLSATSYRSMAHMREMAPRMQSLKEKFGDDKQKLQQAMMEMYRKEKINPLSGCLPILVQIPVFIALYWVLLGSVELRHAPFFGWITDLSAKDPYYILPILMGASMIVQTYLNPAPADPLQAKIMKIMPVVFSIFFFFFPAGLVLYWLVNNILSIAQQWYINKTIHAETLAKKAVVNVNSQDTIAAIATASGAGGIGIVRVSGALCAEIATHILGHCPSPRYAAYLDFKQADGELIDRGIAIYYNAPHSYTGEDVLELQGHGGTALMQILLARCIDLGARQATPGEFTRRAYLNDKLDLAQAEAVADVINAATAEAAKSAVRSLSGEFSQTIHAFLSELINLRLFVEACLDFPEEEIDFITQGRVAEKIANNQQVLETIFSKAKQGVLLRDGVNIVLIGQPNVGKSSLMNALSGEEVAIVTSIAGTTRDAIKSEIQINGVPLHIIDTAGLRDTDDEVEKIGIARTYQATETAHIALLLVDVAHGIGAQEKLIIERLPQEISKIWVHNKIDVSNEQPQVVEIDDASHIYLSAKTGQGLDLLKSHLLSLVGYRQNAEGVFMARARHLAALDQVKLHLEQASKQIHFPELVAEELRLAQESLSSITGEFTPDDLLGEIFSKFCIGK